jgi:hypothetical protein
MSTIAEVDELHRLIVGLRQHLKTLVSRYGDSPATRRVLNDAEHIQNGIDRLYIDVEELGQAYELTSPTRPCEMIQIPDTPYEPDFWRDVDDEGIGGQTGAYVRISRMRKRR